MYYTNIKDYTSYHNQQAELNDSNEITLVVIVALCAIFTTVCLMAL